MSRSSDVLLRYEIYLFFCGGEDTEVLHQFVR